MCSAAAGDSQVGDLLNPVEAEKNDTGAFVKDSPLEEHNNPSAQVFRI